MRKLLITCALVCAVMVAMAAADLEVLNSPMEPVDGGFLRDVTKAPSIHMPIRFKEGHIPQMTVPEEIQEDMIAYDGNPQYYYPSLTEVGTIFDVRFTPLQACTLSYISVVFYQGVGGSVTIRVRSDVGGMPGADLITPMSVVVTGSLTRQQIDIPDIDIGANDFHVEVEYSQAPPPFVTFDGDGNTENRSIVWIPSSAGWYLVGGDLNFRAFVRYYGVDVIPPTIIHDPISAGFSYDGNYIVKAQITDNTGVSSADVFYSINGGPYTQVPMAFASGYYTAQIPAQVPGTLIEYYLYAEDLSLNYSYLPADSSDDPFYFFVYPGRELKYEEGQYWGGYRIPDSTVADRRFAVRFTPTRYPSVITMLRYLIYDSTAFDIALSYPDGPGGVPGTTFYGPETMASPYPRGFHWLNWIIPGPQMPMVNSGDFYAEMRYKPLKRRPYLGADSTAPDGRSLYLAHPDSGWRTMTTDDYVIRAVVVDTFFSHDVGVTNIDSLPYIGGRSYCDQEIWVNVYNYGQNPETFPVQVKITDFYDTMVVFYDTSIIVPNLQAKTGVLMHFPAWQRMEPGEYLILARTLLPTDQYPYNDMDAWYFPVGHLFAHLWDDGIAEGLWIVRDTSSINDYFAVRFRPVEPNFKVDGALIFASVDSGIVSAFEWLRVCPSLNDSTPDINNPYADTANVVVDTLADVILIDFPDDPEVTGHMGYIWVVVKWYPGQIYPNMPAVFSDETDPDGMSFWTTNSIFPAWRQDNSLDWIFRLYLAYEPCETLGVCEYVPGDINGDDQVRGSDVTYGVRYFKGLGPAPPDSCYHPSLPGNHWLYVAGDVNGNCEFRGSDITKLVAYFKGTTSLSYCSYFPPPLLRQPAELPIQTARLSSDHRLPVTRTPQAPFLR